MHMQAMDPLSSCVVPRAVPGVQEREFGLARRSQTSSGHISINKRGASKNYAAIDRAATARSNSDEFFVCNPIVIEISLIFCEITWR